MRILGDIKHPVFKITAFISNGKTSVKIEDSLLEQIIKFRDGSGVDTIEDVKAIINNDFLDEIVKSFQIVHKAKMTSLLKLHAFDEGFDEII